MKTAKILFSIFAIGLIVFSCKDDEPFYQVNTFETAMHEYINEYRISQGKSSLVWFPDIFIEAREQSKAYKTSGDYTTGLNERIGKIQDHWAPTKLGYGAVHFIGQADTTWARAVINSWIADSSSNVVLLDDYVQYGAGLTQGEEVAYVFQFLMTIPTK